MIPWVNQSTHVFCNITPRTGRKDFFILTFQQGQVRHEPRIVVQSGILKINILG
jgi:hypothetical protein